MLLPRLSFCPNNNRMFIHVCAWCLRVRTVLGQWHCCEQRYLNHTGLYCTHGICPDCTQMVLKELGIKQDDPKGISNV